MPDQPSQVDPPSAAVHDYERRARARAFLEFYFGGSTDKEHGELMCELKESLIKDEDKECNPNEKPIELPDDDEEAVQMLRTMVDTNVFLRKKINQEREEQEKKEAQLDGKMDEQEAKENDHEAKENDQEAKENDQIKEIAQLEPECANLARKNVKEKLKIEVLEVELNEAE
jgi:transposase